MKNPFLPQKDALSPERNMALILRCGKRQHQRMILNRS